MVIIVLKGVRSFVIPTNKQINKNAWSIVVASNLQTRLPSLRLNGFDRTGLIKTYLCTAR